MKTGRVFEMGLRILAYLLFTAGCMYQCARFFENYFQYPTAIETEILSASRIQFPAVTVCNNNRYVMSRWKELKLPAFSNKGNTSEQDLQELKDLTDSFNKTRKIYLAPSMDEFILYCSFEGIDCSKLFTQFYDYEYTNCFTFNAAWDNHPDHFPDAMVFDPITGHSSVLMLFLHLHHDEYSPLYETYRAAINIHPRHLIPDPGFDATSLEAGLLYTVGLRKTIQELLPSPYQAKCVSYEGRTERRTNASMDQNSCLSECYFDEMINDCNCTKHRLGMMYDAPICKEEKHKSNCLEKSIRKVEEACAALCGIDCKIFQADDSFTASPSTLMKKEYFRFLQLENISDELLPKTFEDFQKDIVMLNIHYVVPEIEISRQRPLYQFIEGFSSVGGYIGFWLGISLLSISLWALRWVTAFIGKKKVVRRRRKVLDLKKRKLIW